MAVDQTVLSSRVECSAIELRRSELGGGMVRLLVLAAHRDRIFSQDEIQVLSSSPEMMVQQFMQPGGLKHGYQTTEEQEEEANEQQAQQTDMGQMMAQFLGGSTKNLATGISAQSPAELEQMADKAANMLLGIGPNQQGAVPGSIGSTDIQMPLSDPSIANGGGVISKTLQLPTAIATPSYANENIGGGVIGSGYMPAHPSFQVPPNSGLTYPIEGQAETSTFDPDADNDAGVGNIYLPQLGHALSGDEEAGEPEEGFVGHVAALHDDRQLWVQGGCLPKKEYVKDLWMYDFDAKAWSKQPQVSEDWGHPKPRCNHTGVMKDGKLWIFGGHAGSMKNDVWEYDTAWQQWTKRNTTYGLQPVERTHATSVVDPNGIIYVHGGLGAFQNGPLSDLWSWQLSPTGGNQWMEIRSSQGPASIMGPRYGVSHAWMEGMYFFGGWYRKVYLDEIWFWNPDGDQWNKVFASDMNGYPQARMFHASGFRSALLVHGGLGVSKAEGEEGNKKVFSDFWGLDVKYMTWKQIQAGGAKPPAMWGHRSFRRGMEWCIMGGENEDAELLKDIRCYDASLNKWRVEYAG